MQKWMKLAVGVLGGLVVAAGVVVITASAAGVNLAGLHSSGATSTATTSPSPSPTPSARASGAANPAARAVNQAALQAEAQTLGLQPRQPKMDLPQGMTPHQGADRHGNRQ